MKSREHAESAAAAWIARREREDWSAVDEAELNRWIAESVDNRVAWLRVHTAWQQTSRLKSLVSTAQPGTVPAPEEIRQPFFDAASDAGSTAPGDSLQSENEHVPPQVRSRKPALGSRVQLIGIAASVLLAMASVLAWHLMPRGPAYHTEIGALQAVPLPDGSRVTLNTNTALRVNVTPSERRVNLDRGEAYFEVAKDPNRPFVVQAGDKRVVAVGTQFSVRRENNELRIFVAEGTVRLESAEASRTGQTGAATAAGGNASVEHPILLPAGSIARAEADNVLVREKPVIEVEQLLSWRTGHLVFDKTPLADAAAEFNRYNTRKIVIQDPRVAAIPVGGSFRATNVDGFVRLISSDLSINATQQGDTIVLSAAPAP
jgi:transmembrane sensor